MNYIARTYHFLRKRVEEDLHRAADFRQARTGLLSGNELTDKEKDLLSKVSLRVHRDDGMYSPSDARQYLSVGLSAIRCIENALDKSNRDNPVQSILDLPCGYGRVLRFLKVRFPDAKITAAEIGMEMLDYCKRVFSVNTLISDADFGKLSLPDKFDLIWCGSLITHIDQMAATRLLKFFHDRLSPGGLCVFTTHGLYPVGLIQRKEYTYGLTTDAQQELLSQFHEKGYGYADYQGQPGYGISAVSHARMLEMARSVGQWDETSFQERGWDNHQDVYSMSR